MLLKHCKHFWCPPPLTYLYDIWMLPYVVLKWLKILFWSGSELNVEFGSPCFPRATVMWQPIMISLITYSSCHGYSSARKFLFTRLFGSRTHNGAVSHFVYFGFLTGGLFGPVLGRLELQVFIRIIIVVLSVGLFGVSHLWDQGKYQGHGATDNYRKSGLKFLENCNK